MIRTILIDDEEDGRVSLQLAIEKFCPELEIVAMCDGPEKGIEAIREQLPDLVFLDIQMPVMSGFEMLAKLDKTDFQVIFVTAHERYAIKAIRFAALDYLLKPIDIDDLVSAVGRLREKTSLGADASHIESVRHNTKTRLGTEGKLAIPSTSGMEFIEIKDIIYCRADGSYTEVVLDNGNTLLVSKGLKEFENILDLDKFCRVHHSSLIGLAHVQRYIKGEGGYVIMSNGDHIDISRRRKEEFMKQIDKL